MATTVAAPRQAVRYHPIRGGVYGLLFGLGLALLLMVFKVLALSVPVIIVLGVLFLVLGAVWGRFAPPRSAKGAPPASTPARPADMPRVDNPPPAAEMPAPAPAPATTPPPTAPPPATPPPA